VAVATTNEVGLDVVRISTEVDRGLSRRFIREPELLDEEDKSFEFEEAAEFAESSETGKEEGLELDVKLEAADEEICAILLVGRLLLNEDEADAERSREVDGQGSKSVWIGIDVVMAELRIVVLNWMSSL